MIRHISQGKVQGTRERELEQRWAMQAHTRNSPTRSCQFYDDKIRLCVVLAHFFHVPQKLRSHDVDSDMDEFENVITHELVEIISSSRLGRLRFSFTLKWEESSRARFKRDYHRRHKTFPRLTHKKIVYINCSCQECEERSSRRRRRHATDLCARHSRALVIYSTLQVNFIDFALISFLHPGCVIFRLSLTDTQRFSLIHWILPFFISSSQRIFAP